VDPFADDPCSRAAGNQTYNRTLDQAGVETGLAGNLEIGDLFGLRADRLFEVIDANRWGGKVNSTEPDQLVAGMDGLLMASDAGIRTDRESVPGGRQTADWVILAWGSIHMAVAAFEAGVGVRAVGE